MRLREVIGCLCGSSILYAIMAACTASDDGHSLSPGSGGSTALTIGGLDGVVQTRSRDQNGAGQVGAHSDQGGRQASGGIWDALTDPVSNAGADPVNGTRLKAKYRIGSDGSKAYIPLVWYDSQRQEDCSYAMAADGKERCMPSSNLYTGLYFSDSACTQSIVSTSSACPPKYVISYDTTACSATAGNRIFSLGSPINPSSVYVKSGSSCMATSPSANMTYYQVGAEIPPAAFVQGSVRADL